MRKSGFLWVCVVLVLSISIESIQSVEAQSFGNENNSSTTSENRNSGVSVGANLTVEVNNDSLSAKNKMLGTAIIGFLSSGPTILKTPNTPQPIVNTRINNQINDTTQSLEGVEATNAIIGVEINKALKSVNSSSHNLNQTGVVTVEISSTCEPSGVKLISCNNVITIK
jgi:hypothetical protein